MHRTSNLLVSQLIEGVRSPGYAEFLSVLSQLIREGADQAAVSPLRQVLRESDGERIRKAILALGEIGPSSSAALPEIIGAFESEDAQLRQIVAAALGRIGSPTSDAENVLVRALR